MKKITTFFRSLEPGDIKDLEEGNIKDENGKYIRLRTDRERWEGTHSIKPRWNAESTVTLEEMYNHIKMHYSLKQTVFHYQAMQM